MVTDSTDASSGGKISFSHRQSRDGLQEQVILLNQLSVKLDEYFALRTFGPGNDRTG